MPEPDITIHTDSNLLGRRVKVGFQPSGGRWKSDEIATYINVLEFQAILIGIGQEMQT